MAGLPVTPTGPGENGKPWVPTADDPLCGDCGQPKHTHISGVGTSTVDPSCKGYKAPKAPVS